MIYLKDFYLPKDSWVDWYFSPTEEVNNPEDLPYYMPVASEMTGFNTYYPWKTFYGREFESVHFDDITIFCGGNGSGKTTLLNVIAQKLGVPRSALYNRSSFFEDYIQACDYQLLDNSRCIYAIQRGAVVTSDDVFSNMLKIREDNMRIDLKREDLVKEYFDKPDSYDTLPVSVNTEDPQETERYSEKVRAYRGKGNNKSCSKFVKSRLEKNKQELSNGETAFEYFVNSVHENCLLLLDEPENSLSAEWQIELTKFLTKAIDRFQCQLIIATHSPFLLSIPGAKIYDLDYTPVDVCEWYEVNDVKYYFEFFKKNERFFQYDFE